MIVNTRIVPFLVVACLSLSKGTFLDGLGDRIEQRVREQLKPLRVLTSIENVKSGFDGTTIATFGPHGRQFIISEGITYECTGTISDYDGSCSGDLVQFSPKKDEDFCFVTPNAKIYGWYCFSSSHNVNAGRINGKPYCSSNDDSYTLLISADDYDSMCENIGSAPTYKYFTYDALEDFGNGLECSGDNPQVCTYSDTA